MEARASTRVREVLLPQAIHLQSCLLLKWLSNVWPSGARDPKGQVPRESTPPPRTQVAQQGPTAKKMEKVVSHLLEDQKERFTWCNGGFLYTVTGEVEPVFISR